MTLPLKVLGDRVLVKPDVNTNAPEQTDSGVLIATSLAAAVTGEDATQSINRGTVIAVGHPKHQRASEAEAIAAALVSLHRPGHPQCDPCRLCEAPKLLRDLVQREPCCAIGDDVLFAYDAGQSITLDGETYILLHETDLLAVVEPEKECVNG